MWRIIAPLAIAGVLAVVAAGMVLALNYDGEDFCQDAPGWPNGSYLGQMHPYHSEFYRGYAERRGWDPCTTWAADQQRSAVRGLAELGYTVIKPGQTVAVTVPAPTPTASGAVPQENYPGENYCRDAPGWPNGTYLGQMHPYHSEFYRGYAERRGWDPCATWATDQRHSAIRGLRELGYTVLEPIVSLDVNGTTILSSIGETSQFSVTAPRSDGPSHGIDSSLVEWGSSDPWVVTVSQGLVTAVGAGNALISASFQGLKAEAPVSVRISERGPGTVRVVYASPSDREFRPDYSEATSHAIVDLQSWYRRQLGGLTFSLHQATPEYCQMSRPEEFYATGHAWDKVVEGVQHCAPVIQGGSDFVWVVYVDVMESCDEHLEFGQDAHELGRGSDGLTILPRGDLEGLTNPGPYHHCGEGPYDGSLGRWIGGLGHELGHAFGLPHPPGCDPWDAATCDHREASSLMHAHWLYPETYLLPSDKEILIRSPFFEGEPTNYGDSLGTLSEPTLRGVVLGPDGESSEGLWVSLIADSFWGWGETGRNGTFEIRLPEGSSGSSILSIHSGDRGDCGWRGYYGPGGFTTQRNRATRVEVGGANVTGIEVRLPVRADRLCSRQSASTIQGKVVGPNNQPLEGILLWGWAGRIDDSGFAYTREDGFFAIEVPDGSFTLDVHIIGRECTQVGWYGPGGFTSVRDDATRFEIAGESVVGIVVRLPDHPGALPCV